VALAAKATVPLSPPPRFGSSHSLRSHRFLPSSAHPKWSLSLKRRLERLAPKRSKPRSPGRVDSKAVSESPDRDPFPHCGPAPASILSPRDHAVSSLGTRVERAWCPRPPGCRPPEPPLASPRGGGLWAQAAGRSRAPVQRLAGPHRAG
jgi:hypothetical protein